MESQIDVQIIDTEFKHTFHLGKEYVYPLLKWNRIISNKSGLIVFTDNCLDQCRSYPEAKKVALLIEPEAINSKAYDYIRMNNNLFSTIITHHNGVIISPKLKTYYYGGTWIKTSEWEIKHKKEKSLSIIASHKNWTEGHLLRHECIKRFGHLGMDVYGTEYSYIENKITGLGPYRFSMVIENSRRDMYFTEKLIDCFAARTIPIYWGPPSIGSIFDPRGIIHLPSLNETILKNIIENSEYTYRSMSEAIENNWKIAKNYRAAEQSLYPIIKELM